MDESGFMLQPLVRRTWAPKGQTPIHYSWDRRDRLSVISAITLSPQRIRLGFYFEVFDRNITAAQAEPFIATLLAHFPRGIILVLDRWSVHRSAARKLRARFSRRMDIEWLPAYAPELNPVEYAWSRTKYGDLANYLPRDIVDLDQSVRHSLRRTQSQQTLLGSFFQHAKLKF